MYACSRPLRFLEGSGSVLDVVGNRKAVAVHDVVGELHHELGTEPVVETDGQVPMFQEGWDFARVDLGKLGVRPVIKEGCLEERTNLISFGASFSF